MSELSLEERVALDGFEDWEPLMFYAPKDEWGVFSNFSRHPVKLPHPWTGEIMTYPTSEHRYQAMKAQDAHDHNWVAGFDSTVSITPGESKDRGGPKGIVLRPDWGDSYHDLCYHVMFEVIVAKTLQHQTMQDALLDSAGRPLYEDSPTDAIWGVRYNYKRDYRGKNLLGQCLSEVRSLFYGHPPTRPFHL